jgi:hypothetical protein
LGYRAGVDNGYLGVSVFIDWQPIARFQLPGNGIGFRLIYLATQGADFKGWHFIPDETVFFFFFGSQNYGSTSMLN